MKMAGRETVAELQGVVLADPGPGRKPVEHRTYWHPMPRRGPGLEGQGVGANMGR
jgi:hypothetical protein